MARQRVITFIPSGKKRFHSKINLYTVVDTVEMAFPVGVDEKVWLRVQFYVESLFERVPEKVICLAETRPEITEIDANLPHTLSEI